MADSSEKELVKERADILQVLAPYVVLKRAGRVWKGLCPFHNEKTPSFTVDPERKLWHCFGQCGEGGDAIKFLQKIENLTFREALERLALQVGVTLSPLRTGAGRRSGQEQKTESEEPAAPSERDRLYAAVECAARFYEENLAQAPVAKTYLGQRAIGTEAQRTFRLGYAGEDWDALASYLTNRGVALKDAVTAGLLSLSDRGGHFDRLRGRIIFPILDVQERIIGFGGRLMEAVEGRPKYLNSAETPLFTKGRNLYGLWRARKAIAAADQAIVVEGYMDVIACHQAGVENVVAALGTSLTEQHAQLIGRYARRVLLSFDADTAGLKAAQRAANIFAAQEIEALMLDLPEGEDPDSLLRLGRQADFVRAIESALPVAEYHLRKVLARPGIAGATEQEKLAVFHREVLPVLRGAKSVMERERYIRLVAPLHPHYGVGAAYAEEQIRQEVERPGGGSPPYAYRSGSYTPRMKAWERRPEKGYYENKYYNDGRFGEKNADRGRRYDREYRTRPLETGGLIPIEAQNAEQILLRALLEEHEDLRNEIAGSVCPEDFQTPAYRALAERRIAEIRADSETGVGSDEDPDLESVRTKLLLEGQASGVPIDLKAVKDSIARLKQLAMKRRVEELRAKAAEGDPEAAAEYLRRQQERRQ